MKYQTQEESQIFNDQSQNRFSEAESISDFNLTQKNNQKKEWTYVNPCIYIKYCLLNGISLSVGCFLKLLFPISRETRGKKSILTGIPIIRNYYFVFPLLLNLIYFIWCIYKYYTDSSISFENNLFKFLKEIRGAFLFTNILLLIIFYVLYYLVVLPTYKSFGFKLSGHIIASILSGGMIVNLHNTYEPFINLKNDPNFNKYISYDNKFLYYHSIYTIFWSAWIFHRVLELIFAYAISIISLVLAHVINVDELFLNLIDFSARKNPVILYRYNN